MSVMCVGCHEEKHPDLGWHWPGSQKGYGPFDFVCNICGKTIWKVNENNQTSV